MPATARPQASNELYRTNLARGQTGLSVAFDLPTQTGYDSDHPLAGGRGRQGRRAGRLDRRHGDPVRRHPARADEHLDDHQRDRALAARALHRRGRAAGCGRAKLQGTIAERHHQGIPVARDLHLPARALAAADRRRDRLHLPRAAEVEPDQRLQLPPAGGRAPRRCRSWPTRWPPRSPCSTRSATAARCPRPISPQVGRPHQLLRQCRHPLRHRDVQDARLRRAVGRDLPRALRRRRRQAAPVPLRRAGQLAWA